MKNNRASILFIHATNIHQGGGAHLLTSLLRAIDSNCKAIVNVDQRMVLPTFQSHNLEIRRIKKTIFSRLRAELFLFFKPRVCDHILCFGNLPPLLPVKAFTAVFVQNRYIIDQVNLNRLQFWQRLRIQFERLWFRLNVWQVDLFLVQTLSMQRLLCQMVKSDVPVVIAPFFEANNQSFVPRVPNMPKTIPKFLYVASGDGHKNHRELVDAWRLLAMEGIRPQLVLTIDDLVYPELCRWITAQSNQFELLIINVGNVDNSKLINCYQEANALIYPSLIESFGIPLVEASLVGLDIVAAELDYVRDVVRPIETFDPTSAISIARAVKRYCGHKDPDIKLLSVTECLDIFMGKTR